MLSEKIHVTPLSENNFRCVKCGLLTNAAHRAGILALFRWCWVDLNWPRMFYSKSMAHVRRALSTGTPESKNQWKTQIHWSYTPHDWKQNILCKVGAEQGNQPVKDSRSGRFLRQGGSSLKSVPVATILHKRLVHGPTSSHSRTLDPAIL